VCPLKQTTLIKWFKEKSHHSTESKKPPIRVTLNVDSSIREYQELIAEAEGEKIALYLKHKQIPVYVAKISKSQFLELCNLGDELSPSTIKAILPELDDILVLNLCQFLLSQRSKKLESQKANLFSY
jgi:hypothetical protein